jgi:DNA-binding CsgD family transcriptional regulator
MRTESPGLVGREEELSAVASALAAGLHVLLEGEAGIGKTAVWEAALAAVGGTVLACRPTAPEADLAYAALGDLVGPAFGDLASALPPPQRRALEVALLLAEPGPAPPEPRAIGLAVVALVSVLAEGGPVVVAVDDAQWVDAPSAQVLAFALRRMPATALVAARPGTESLVESVCVPLRPLSVGALHRLLRERLELSLPRPALVRLHEVCGGNPFYALELARVLGRDGATGPGPLVADVVRARIESLPAPLREALQLAAALGDPTLAALGDAAAALDDPAATELVEVVSGRIRFAHPLFAAAALATAGEERRRAIHRRLADAPLAPEERARHLALAADGPDPEAAAALAAAARAAAARGAPAAAAELAELAAGLSAAPEERAERLLAAAAHHASAGAVDRGRRLLEPLREALDAGPLRARVLLQLAHPNDDADAALALCAQALAEAEADARVLAEAHRTRHELAILRGDTDDALAHARAPVAAAERAGDDALLARCLGDASLVETWTGDVTEGWLERAVELERATPGFPMLYAPSVVLAIRQKYRTEIAVSRASFEDALERAEAAGDDAARIAILLHLADLELRAGAFPAARERVGAGLELAEQADDRQWQAALLSVSTRIEAALGRADAAREAARRGIELADASGSRIFRLQCLGALGFLALAEDDLETASRLLAEVVPPLPPGANREPGTLQSVPDAAEALAAGAGDPGALVGELRRAGERGNRAAAAVAERVEARRLAPEDAAPLLERAAASQAELGLPFERARTLLALGSVHRRAKRKADARATLEEARDAFAALGAALWTERAEAELERIGGRRRSAGLTPTEARVAALVAAGRSNKEVAAELFVTVRTVESNLTRVYEKLGVRSRTELASRLR